MATTDTWDSPALDQPIRTDLPALQVKLQALVKADPSVVQNPPVGAKRLVEISSGNWQVQEYNGSTWSNLGKLKMDVDTVDGFDAAITPKASTIAVRNASGKLEGDITGHAASADIASTLSSPLGVELGGSGATTPEQARNNFDVPPTSHASTTTTHGVGTATQYGHLKLSDAVDSASGASGGVAATPAAVKEAKAAADAAQKSADFALQKLETPATSDALGPVKVGDGLSMGEDGTLSLDLVDAVDSTSATQGATANAVKMAYDKAMEAINMLSVGSLFPSFATSMPGCLLGNGAAVSRTTYANLFAVFGIAFGAGDGSTTFNLPDFRDKTLWGANDNLKAVIAAGLPDIDGAFYAPVPSNGGSTTGAFSASGTYNATPGNGTAGRKNSFLASDSNKIYGKSKTVQPPAIAVNIFIKY